jgi:hypothetical protein
VCWWAPNPHPQSCYARHGVTPLSRALPGSPKGGGHSGSRKIGVEKGDSLIAALLGL